MSKFNRVALEKFVKFSEQHILINTLAATALISLDVKIKRNERAGKPTGVLKVCKYAISGSYSYFLVDKISKI